VLKVRKGCFKKQISRQFSLIYLKVHKGLTKKQTNISAPLFVGTSMIWDEI